MMVSTKGEKNGRVHTTCFAGLSLCGLNDCNLKTVNGKPVDCPKCLARLLN